MRGLYSSGSCTPEASWTERYGAKHCWRRLQVFPVGLTAPKKVRVYQRGEHFLLNFWNPEAGKNRSERIEGDLLTALIRAREIDERLVNFKRSGLPRLSRVGHQDLVDAFLEDLRTRAEAGEIAPNTVRRYGDALRHYLDFCRQAEVQTRYKAAARIDREFRLAFLAYLTQLQVTSNGRKVGAAQRMKSMTFVSDTVRAMLQWAADPQRGQLLPQGFVNPFVGGKEGRSILKGDPLAEPDITFDMAIDLVGACDAFQLRLLAPMLLFGLRAEEPRFLFGEYLEGGWLRVPCNAELEVRTKGRLDKRFPLLEHLEPFWSFCFGGRPHGLVYVRRTVAVGRERAVLTGTTLEDLIAQYRTRCRQAAAESATARLAVRDRLLKDAGAIDYDGIDAEFRAVARKLGWPRPATLKDLRHLFATTMMNAGLPEAYRRYLLGQSQGKAAIVAYTHLHELKRHFEDAVRKEWQPLVEAILRRVAVLGRTGQAAA